ncbi:MAG: hypothetical protein IJL92_10530 [Thermoguttaceae bacterium]|nr:hypothetical protein [Thermoguttaceae bacterium]
MSDDVHLNGDGSGREAPGGNGSSGQDVNELIRKIQSDPELLKRFLSDPNLRSQLQTIVGESEPSPERPASPPSRPQAPTGAPTARSASAGKSSPRVPSALPSSLPTTRPSGRSLLPNAKEFDRSAPIRRSAPMATSPRSKEPQPSSVEASTAIPVESASDPQVVPVPPLQSGVAERSADSGAGARFALPSRRRARDKGGESEPAPDLSHMTPLSSRPSPALSSLAAIAAPPASRRSGDASVGEGILKSLVVADPLAVKDSSDLFLEMLERRTLPTAEQKSSEDAAFLRDETAFERAANDAPMWLISLIFHLILIVILALLVVNAEFRDNFEIVSTPGFSDEVVLDEVFDPEAAFETTENVDFETTDVPEVETDVVADVPDVSAFTEETAAPLTMTETALALDAAPLGDVENMLGSLNGSDLSGRGENKAAALAAGGGTEGSEKSVALALAWLAEHQRPDGSWSYNMNECPSCGGKCRDSGSNSSTIAATAMGVLPFLAAGYTPTKGKYKKVVAKGINYLIDQGQETEFGLSFRDGPGNMYSHGLATIALCETYAMLDSSERSRYRKLQYITQEAEQFIEYAQASDGGWRYEPKEAGDTSVSGWQMMALKSAQMAGLNVSSDVIIAYRSFLRDVVSYEDGSRYFYKRGILESDSTDAIGLLCRLYMDWGIDNPSLIKGVDRLADADKSLNNPYYTYYAALLLYQVGGRVWNKWNREMREKLIKTQRLDGHERGSWYPDKPDVHCMTGGRLYATSLNCLVLEVYYRFMPLNRKLEESEAFPLEGPDAEKESGSAEAPASAG